MIYTEKDLPQGSQKWLDWRMTGITGTEAAAIHCQLNSLPVPDWAPTIAQILQTKLGQQIVEPPQPIPEINARRGHYGEPIARAQAETVYGTDITPLCLDHNDWLKVSLDGYGSGYLVEIKSPINPWSQVPEIVKAQTAYQLVMAEYNGLMVDHVRVLEAHDVFSPSPRIVEWELDPEPLRTKGRQIVWECLEIIRRHWVEGESIPLSYRDSLLISNASVRELAERYIQIQAMEKAIKEEKDRLSKALADVPKSAGVKTVVVDDVAKITAYQRITDCLKVTAIETSESEGKNKKAPDAQEEAA